MKQLQAKELLNRYKNGSCTEEEIALLESWYLEAKDKGIGLTESDLTEAKNKVWSTLPVHEMYGRKTVNLWKNIAAAASIVIAVAAGMFFYYPYKNTGKEGKMDNVAEIVPGSNKAILTLANGSKISLTDAVNGKLASQSGVVISKTKDGQLIYHVIPSPVSHGTDNQKVIEYNTISTPRGGQYRVILPDGTAIVLNSASSLKYPTSFSGARRTVELTGEAYFEVAHKPDMPFIVYSNLQSVEVLGTHFNISAYPDEADIKTTLLEGKVRINVGSKTPVILSPGEQATVIQNSISVSDVYPEDVIAWTKNVFVFNNEELGSIMRKISRWYDVEVICPDEIARIKFAGSVSRGKNIREVLKIMELTESIHFKFEERRITVMP
ncbi:FecR family protein [Pedobacter psychroterrae]|uniref:FecR family protein n=1 Tax=Pedobacter psychroterrae TaxID=2530453 RepID=A0A4R0NWS4_9SPHI|nr:FecR domain-containing protein [Pedobacter psychroterrae]TCD03514.1 FecR family protein [Pedobacter psychroterrae]